MIRLTRLTINRFRNVKPGTDMRFGPTFNVLLGKNATGKTTLLDLIAAVINCDLSRYEQESFELIWCLEEGNDTLEIHAKRKLFSKRLSRERAYTNSWTATLKTEGEYAGSVEVEGTRGVWLLKDGSKSPFDVKTLFGRSFIYATISLEQSLSRIQDVRRLAEAMSRFAMFDRGGRFDEATGMFQAIANLPFEVNLHNGQMLWTSAPFPLDFIRARTWEEPLGPQLEKAASMREIPSILGFSSFAITPKLIEESSDEEGVRARHYQGFDFMFRRADGSEISHERLSFGQKRLFSFLWYLAVRGELPVVADELLNGLHYEWINLCIERLEGRQSFLATQDPFLLDHIPIESKEAVRTTFVRCSLEQDENKREQMVWRNFTEEEAERFFVAYETGVQHVSEVLRSEGLW